MKLGKVCLDLAILAVIAIIISENTIKQHSIQEEFSPVDDNQVNLFQSGSIIYSLYLQISRNYQARFIQIYTFLYTLKMVGSRHNLAHKRTDSFIYFTILYPVNHMT